MFCSKGFVRAVYLTASIYLTLSMQPVLIFPESARSRSVTGFKVPGAFSFPNYAVDVINFKTPNKS